MSRLVHATLRDECNVEHPDDFSLVSQLGVGFVARLSASPEVRWLRGACPRCIVGGFWWSDTLTLVVFEVTVGGVAIILREFITAEIIVEILKLCF